MTRKVGYGSPPNHTKWQKGQSGNPGGRRKGQRNLSTVVRAELARKVRLPDGKTVSMLELIARQLVAKVVKGELKWFPLMMRFVQLDSPADDPGQATFDANDNKLMEEFLVAYRGHGEEE